MTGVTCRIVAPGVWWGDSQTVRVLLAEKRGHFRLWSAHKRFEKEQESIGCRGSIPVSMVGGRIELQFAPCRGGALS